MPMFSKKPALMMVLFGTIVVAGFFMSERFNVKDDVSVSNNGSESGSLNEVIYEITGPIMGTSYHIKVVLTDDGQQLDNLRQGVTETLQRVDRLMSTYKPASEVSRFNRAQKGQWFAVSSETFEVISLGQSLSLKSGGYYDMTVGPLVNSWGFGPSGKPTRIPDEGQLLKLRKSVGYDHLIMDDKTSSIMKDEDIYLDLSSIAKGYSVDRVAEYLEDQHIADFLVEVGGEIRANGRKPNGSVWRLAIESPTIGERSVYKVIELTNAGLATSGDYRNYYEEEGVRYSHTIDPFTGKPVQHRLTSVSVIRPSSAEADAMATMFMVMGVERGYMFAVENDIAAYFIVRSESGFESKVTEPFTIYLTQ